MMIGFAMYLGTYLIFVYNYKIHGGNEFLQYSFFVGRELVPLRK
jgi:hypothetical protein